MKITTFSKINPESLPTPLIEEGEGTVEKELSVQEEVKEAGEAATVVKKSPRVIEMTE